MQVQQPAEVHLAPQQLGVAVKGGISILVHGIRLLLEERGDFVAVKLDLRNAYNAISRQTVLRRVAAVPSLAHLVPFLHALWASPTDLYVDKAGKRLFNGQREPDGTERGDSSEGVQQGKATSAT